MRKEAKHSTKESHQTEEEESKVRIKGQRGAATQPENNFKPKFISVNNYILKCITFFNQKTWSGASIQKIKPIYMLPIRDSYQM